MRALEYIYLAGAIGAASAYVALQSKMESSWLLLVGTVIFAFMYSFRRKQRLQLEAWERQKAEKDNESQP